MASALRGYASESPSIALHIAIQSDGHATRRTPYTPAQRMKKTEFSERQYETSFLQQLGKPGVGSFQPTLGLEWYLGIDAATDACNAHRIWNILNVAVPRRLQLSHDYWPRLPLKFHKNIQNRVVSLFFQFKVAKFQDGNRAKYRSQFKTPYFEVPLTRHQQTALARLERRVCRKAVVRYASPAFWSHADIIGHTKRSVILAHSAFLSPSKVGVHKKWMYAGPSGKCILNPVPDETNSESWDVLTDVLAKQAEKESIEAHVRGLAESLRADEESPLDADDTEWLQAIREYSQLSEEDVRYLSSLRTVGKAAERADTTWLIMFEPDEDSNQILQNLPWPFHRWCW